MGVSLVYYLMDATCLLKGLRIKALGLITLMSLSPKKAHWIIYLSAILRLINNKLLLLLSGQHQFSRNNYQYGITTKGYKN